MLSAGISALQEVKRISCNYRFGKASFYLAEAAALIHQNTMRGLNLLNYKQSLVNGDAKVDKVADIDISA